MATVTELGALVKQKYPGAYDDLDDTALGQLVRERHPGAYDDFSDSPVPSATAVEPGSRLGRDLLKTTPEQTIFSPEHPLAELPGGETVRQFLGQFARSGAGGITGLGTALYALTENPVLRDVGSAVADVGTTLENFVFQPDESDGKDFIEDPSKLTDPHYLAGLFGGAGGSMAFFAGIGLGSAKTADRALQTLRASSRVRQAALAVNAPVSGSVVEAFVQAGQTYNDAVERVGPETASEIAAQTAKTTLGPTLALNAAGLYNNRIKSGARRLAASVFGEIAQEDVQQLLTNMALQEGGIDVSTFEGIPESTLGGAFGGVVGERILRRRGRAIAPPPEPTPIQAEPLTPGPAPAEPTAAPPPPAAAAPAAKPGKARPSEDLEADYLSRARELAREQGHIRKDDIRRTLNVSHKQAGAIRLKLQGEGTIGPSGRYLGPGGQQPTLAEQALPSPDERIEQLKAAQAQEKKQLREDFLRRTHKIRAEARAEAEKRLGVHLQPPPGAVPAPPAAEPAPGQPAQPPLAEQALPEGLTAPETAAQPAELPGALEPTDVSPPEDFGKPGSVGYMNPKEIEFDAPRFQYKRAVGRKGVTAKFRNVKKWVESSAGVIHVWRDPANGKTYVVNGHHRLELAQRLNAPRMMVRYLEGPTAKDARLQGALINIMEGTETGTSLDAAHIFRETDMQASELAELGVSAEGRMAEEGLALANLAGPIFTDVVEGTLPLARAAIIGRNVETHPDQLQLYAVMKEREKSGNRLTNSQIEEFIRLETAPERQAARAGAKDAQGDLFGKAEIAKFSSLHRAQVSDAIRQRLTKDRRVFGGVSTEAIAERLGEAGNVIEAERNREIAETAGQGLLLYDKLTAGAGPFDAILDEAAQAVAEGRNLNRATDEAYSRVRQQLLEQIAQLTGKAPRGPGGQEGPSVEPESQPAEEAPTEAVAPPPQKPAEPPAVPAALPPREKIRETPKFREAIAKAEELKAAKRAKLTPAEPARPGPPEAAAANTRDELLKLSQPELKIERDRLTQGLAEGQIRLRSGVNAIGEKLSAGELAGVQRSVENTRSRLAAIEELEAEREIPKPERDGADLTPPALARRVPIHDAAAIREALPKARATLHNGWVGLNTEARNLIEELLELPFDGANLDFSTALSTIAKLDRWANQESGPAQTALRDLAETLRQGLGRRLRREDITSLIVAHEGAPFDLPSLLAHERGHTLQRELSAGRITGHINEKAFLDDTLAIKAHDALVRLGYPRDRGTIAAEIGAHLTGGSENWQKLGLSRDEAKQLMQRYVQALRDKHGDKAEDAIRRLAPQLEEVLNEATTFEADFRALVGAREGGPGRDLRPGLRPALSRAEAEEGRQEDLDLGTFDAEAQRGAEARAADRLTKEQIEAEFRTPLTRENQRRKPKGEIPRERQGGLFPDEEIQESQGSLFVRRRVERQPPVTIEDQRRKAELRRIWMQSRNVDVSEARLRNLAFEIAGTKHTSQLTTDQRAELLRRLLATDADGRPLKQPGLPLAENVLHSPSYILGNSRAGAEIYKAAEDWFFKQKQLVRRFDRNYHKVTDGLSKEEKTKLALFRLGINAKGQRVDYAEDWLSPKLRQVNANLTKFVFEPMWQRGVREGLVSRDRHIDDYLTYYQENRLRLVRKDIPEMAANLAMELGVPVGLAEKILENANPKAKKFGPFDYQRAAESTPGLRDLDQIAEIYIKGFARKVAVTNFLKQHDRWRPKIKDLTLKRYAKDYASQYAGQVRASSAEEWLARKVAASPHLRRMNLSVGRIAGAATAVQFMSKIGLNPFTAIQNVTQALTNTVPEIGYVRSLKVFPKAVTASRLGRLAVPLSLNPFHKDIVRLNRSGILDSQLMKFDRPTHTGRLGSALAFMFDTAEEFNRSLSYLGTFENARADGKSVAEAQQLAREAVRVQHFFSGRLDAPLWTRSPSGRVVMQFKTFQVKQMEFAFKHMRHQPRPVKVKFALGLVALGGPAAVGLLQVARIVLDEDDDLLEMIEDWQTTMNIAALLHADNLARQLGVFWIPTLEDIGEAEYDAEGRIFGWAAGPTLSTIADIAVAGSRSLQKPEKGGQLVTAIVRGVFPGGTELRRIKRAMEEARNPRDALRILVNWYYVKRGGKVDPEIRRLLGTDDLLKEIEREQRELLK
jgi:hypothetical protein